MAEKEFFFRLSTVFRSPSQLKVSCRCLTYTSEEIQCIASSFVIELWWYILKFMDDLGFFLLQVILTYLKGSRFLSEEVCIVLYRLYKSLWWDESFWYLFDATNDFELSKSKALMSVGPSNP